MPSVLQLNAPLAAALSSEDWAAVLALAGSQGDTNTQLLYSRVVTFLWAVSLREPLQLREEGVCTVLVAGAAQREETLAKTGAFSLLGELMPEIRWHIVLVGPSLSRGVDHIAGDRVQIDLLTGYLHSWAVRERLKEAPPDCTVLFNSGIGCKLQAVTDPWQRSMPILAQCLPILFTSFSEAEAKREQTACSTVAWEATLGARIAENPFVVPGDHDGRAAPGVVHNRLVWWLASSHPVARSAQLYAKTSETAKDGVRIDTVNGLDLSKSL